MSVLSVFSAQRAMAQAQPTTNKEIPIDMMEEIATAGMATLSYSFRS
jgi:hypothetical protein